MRSLFAATEEGLLGNPVHLSLYPLQMACEYQEPITVGMVTPVFVANANPYKEGVLCINYLWFRAVVDCSCLIVDTPVLYFIIRLRPCSLTN